VRLPAHLSRGVRRWIHGILTDFELEPRHIRLLILAGESWDRGQEARARIDAEGLTVNDRFGQARQHPCIAIERDCRIAFARLLRETGLDTEGVEPPKRPPRTGSR